MDERSGFGQLRLRIGVAFLSLFLVYQAAEALQTVFAKGSALGPVLMLAALVLAGLLGRWLGGKGYSAFGLSISRQSMAVLAGGLFLSALAKLAALSLGLAVGAYGPAAAAPAGLSFAAVAGAALVTIVPSLTEDILTRGFLFRIIPIRLGFGSYVLASAALYTMNHVWRFGWGLSEQLRLFCLGLAYGAAAWRWQTLWGAVALHWGWNFSNQLADLSVPLDGLDRVAGRYVTASVHLAMLAVVLLLPAHRTDEQSAR